jgi:hypothetical protein
MRTLSLIALLAILAPAPALAETAEPARKPAKARFDPATVVTLSGKVLGEQRVDHGKGTKAVRLVIKVGEEQVSVQLGPDSFVDGQKTRFVAGDEVTVKGSKFTYGTNKYGLIAQAVTRGNDTVVFRSAKGKPAWGGTAQAKAGAAADHS